jgi:hypothetical protein
MLESVNSYKFELKSLGKQKRDEIVDNIMQNLFFFSPTFWCGPSVLNGYVGIFRNEKQTKINIRIRLSIRLTKIAIFLSVHSAELEQPAHKKKSGSIIFIENKTFFFGFVFCAGYTRKLAFTMPSFSIWEKKIIHKHTRTHTHTHNERKIFIRY